MMDGLAKICPVVALLALWPAEAAACSPPPGDPVAYFQERETAYLREVTGIYDAVAENVVGDVDTRVSFTLRKVEDVWGEAIVPLSDLEHENGMCSDYVALWLEDYAGRPFQTGERVRVFVNPAAEADPSLLYIIPEGPLADGMTIRWRALRADANRQSQ